MGIRLTNTIFDAEGQDWTINVYDSTYSGATIPIDITAASIRYQANNNTRFAPILPSISEISFRVDGAILNTFVTDFIGAAEKRFRLQVYKGLNIFWVGNIQTDNVRKQDKEYPYIFTIRATDGLSSLKDIDYNDNGTAYEGKERITDHLINALNKIGTSDLFGSEFLSTAINWFSAEHTATTIDPAYNTRFDHKRFVKYDSDANTTYSSCYDVIESIAESIGARLYLSDGTFKLTQVNEYEGNNIKYYHYATTKLSAGSTAATTYRKTDGTDVIRLGGGSYQYYPALREVKVDYIHLQAQSLLPANGITSSDYSGEIIDSGGGTSNFLIRTSIKYSSSEPTAAAFEPIRLHIRLKIAVGAFYLTRTSTSFPVSYSSTTWENTLGYYDIITPLITANGSEQYITISNLVTPAIPADGQLIVSGAYHAAYTANGLPYTPTNKSVSFFDSYIENVPSGFIEDRSNKFTYTVENNETDNSKRLELKVELGDGPSYNALGAFQVWDGSEWVISSGWAVGSIAGTDEVGQLLAQEIISTQSHPAEIISATYNGFISPLYTVYKGSADYAARQLTIDMIAGTSSGLFFECDSTATVFVDKDRKDSFDIEDLISPITPVKGPVTTSPDPIADDDPLIRAVTDRSRLVTIDTKIDENTSVSSIPIEASGIDDLIKSGDRITVIDVVTGQSQDFITTADVSGVDTTISVTTDNADFDINVGSIISFSQEEIIKKINDTQAVSYYQKFTTGPTLTWTGNSGSLPSSDTESKVFVYQNGQKLIEGTSYALNPGSGTNESEIIIESTVHWDGSIYEVIVKADTVTSRYQKFTTGPTLTWTSNGGKFPANTAAAFFVFQNGQKLIEDSSYTLTPNTGAGESTIEIDSSVHWDGSIYEAIII